MVGKIYIYIDKSGDCFIDGIRAERSLSDLSIKTIRDKVKDFKINATYVYNRISRDVEEVYYLGEGNIT